MTGIYELLLRAPDGRELSTLAWFPNDQCKDDYFDKARKRGLTIFIKPTKTESQPKQVTRACAKL